jgi:hypothetical protein
MWCPSVCAANARLPMFLVGFVTTLLDSLHRLRLIQSIPSKKAEPFKLWLAHVGSERIDETADPEIAIDRTLETYLKKGYSRNWINQRLKTIEVRKELTDEWEKHGVTEKTDFAILTDEITRAWSGKTTRQYKELKGLNLTLLDFNQKFQPFKLSIFYKKIH